MLFRISGVIALLSLGIWGCSKNELPAEEIIARVSNHPIEWVQLRRSFELNPKWGKGLTYRQAYLNQLNYLTDQKLFALAARSAGLDQDSLLAQRLEFIHEKEMIKELYRQKVAKRVEISKEEYQQGYRNLKKRIRLNYIFTPDSVRALAYFSRLQFTPFKDLQLENDIQERKGATPLFTFGDMEPQIEEAAFALKLGESAGPLPVKNGFMVIQLAYGETDKFMSDNDFAEKKNKVHKIIWDRKAGQIANRYIKELMLSKNLDLNPPVFYALAGQFSRVVQNKFSTDPSPVYINNEEIRQVKLKLSDISGEVLIRHREGEMTVADFLARLSRMPAELRPKVKTAKQLKDAVGVIVRNEYLVREAEKMRLQDNPTVLRETAASQDAMLAYAWLEKQKKTLQASEAEVSRFKSSRGYESLLQKAANPLSPQEARDILLELKFRDLKIQLSDSLKTVYPVSVDSALFLQHLKTPDKIIRKDPPRIVVRELFY
ncbi:MAG: peptidylprolyl isomerase [Calditrichia bacterium]